VEFDRLEDEGEEDGEASDAILETDERQMIKADESAEVAGRKMRFKCPNQVEKMRTTSQKKKRNEKNFGLEKRMLRKRTFEGKIRKRTVREERKREREREEREIGSEMIKERVRNERVEIRMRSKV
jgi:hypothetical protein